MLGVCTPRLGKQFAVNSLTPLPHMVGLTIEVG
jgi:hypothetical protein